MENKKMELTGFDLDYMLMIYDEYSDCINRDFECRGNILVSAWRELQSHMTENEHEGFTYSDYIYNNKDTMLAIIEESEELFEKELHAKEKGVNVGMKKNFLTNEDFINILVENEVIRLSNVGDNIELALYTPMEIGVIITLRAKSEKTFHEQFNEYVNNFCVDNEIDEYRRIFSKERYTIRELLEDFEACHHDLLQRKEEVDEIASKMSKLTAGELIDILQGYPKGARVLIKDVNGGSSFRLDKDDIVSWTSFEEEESVDTVMFTKYRK